MFLPLACTIISLSRIVLVVLLLYKGIANGTANGPTPAIISATTNGGDFIVDCVAVLLIALVAVDLLLPLLETVIVR